MTKSKSQIWISPHPATARLIERSCLLAVLRIAVMRGPRSVLDRCFGRAALLTVRALGEEGVGCVAMQHGPVVKGDGQAGAVGRAGTRPVVVDLHC